MSERGERVVRYQWRV